MVERQDWIQKQGWCLVVVYKEPLDSLPPLLGKLPLRDVSYLNDRNGDLYASFDLYKGSLRQLVGPAVWWRGFLAVLKGHFPGKVGQDVKQMPGAFVLYLGKIVSAHRATHTADHPDLDAMARDFRSATPE